MTESTPTHLSKYVPDDGPMGARILLVGEAPGENEHLEGKPFIGESGKILIDCLGRHGVSRSEVRLANLCHYRPLGNKFELLLQENILKEGLKELYEYISNYKPNVIGALGGWPLSFLTGRKGIKKWRGSILSYINDESIKVIPTIHPAAVFRDRSLYATFDLDIKRIIDDSSFPERNIPIRRFIIDPRGLECEEWVERLCEAEFLGTDIETVKNSTKILCCGFAPSPDLAVCFVPSHPEGRRAIERVLRSSAKKIFQFGIFDTTQLVTLNGYELKDPEAEALDRLYFWDTLVAQHTLAPELPRSLEYLTSLYTREPYYKTVGRGTIPDDEKGWSEKVDKQSLYEYNCRDCCCTIEIALQQMQEIKEAGPNYERVFQFEMEEIEITQHISNAGMLVDEDRRAVIERVLLEKWAKKQFILNRMVGSVTNVRSPKLKDILYKQLGLPPRYKDKRPTTDEDAIVSLITFCKDKVSSLKRQDAIIEWQIKLGICQTILEIRGIRQVLSNYILKQNGKKIYRRIREDGRVHSTYKSSATETGRWAAMKYVDGSGINSQTLPRDPWDIPAELLTKRAEDVILTQAEVNRVIEEELLSMLDDRDEGEEEEDAAA